MEKLNKNGEKSGKAGLIFGIASIASLILIFLSPLIIDGWDALLPVIVFGWASSVCGILAIIFSCIAQKRGNKRKSITVGLVFGGIGVGITIIPAITFFINIIKHL